MARRYTGGFLSSKEQVTDANSASGIFTTQEAGALTTAGSFPTGRWTPQRSLRFRASASQTLTRTNSVAGNQTTWTMSFWHKRGRMGSVSAAHGFMGCYAGVNNDSNNFEFRFNTSDKFQIVLWNYIAESTAVFRDPSAWYHIVLALDTTQAGTSAGSKVKLYVNGVLQQWSSDSVSSGLSQNATIIWNATTIQYIGRWQGADGGNYFIDGHMAEVNFVDGQALTPSAFGLTDPQTGVWVPKRYAGTYGTTGYYLDFRDNTGTSATTLGADRSGNSNNWTPNSFSVTAGVTNDSMVDVPGIATVTSQPDIGGVQRGNYATWNPLQLVQSTLSQGNLFSTATGASTDVITTFPFPSTGKWYAEIGINVSPNINWPMVMGISSGIGGNTYCRLYTDWSAFYLFYSVNGTTSNQILGSTTPANGDILKIAYDADTGRIWLGLNATWYTNTGALTGNPSSDMSPTLVGVAGLEMYPNHSNAGGPAQNAYLNCGQRAFAYTPPTGFKSLNTTNLPTPVIKRPSEHFDVKTWTGNGTDISIGNTAKLTSAVSINRALQFNSVDHQSLTRTVTTTGNRQKYTYSGWIKRGIVATGTYYQLFGASNNTFAGGNEGVFIDTNVGSIYFTGDGPTTSAWTTKPIKDHNWHHVVVAVDTTSASTADRIKFYLDGIRQINLLDVIDNAQNTSSSYINNAGFPQFIGRHGTDTFNYDGYMAEVNFVDGQQVDVSAFGQFDANNNWVPKRYTGTYGTNGFYLPFDAPTTPDTITYGAAFLAGSGQYLQTPSNAAFQFGTGDFTVEMYVYHTTSGNQTTYFGDGTPGPNAGIYFYRTTSNTLSVYTSSQLINSTAIIPVNQWTHVAVTRSGTSLRLFMDGALVGSATDSTNLTDTGGVFIGNDTGGSGQFVGYMSNVRVVKGTAVYTSGFARPTSNLTAISGTSLLTCRSATIVDTSTNAFTITNTGTVTAATTTVFNKSIGNDSSGNNNHYYPSTAITQPTLFNFVPDASKAPNVLYYGTPGTYTWTAPTGVTSVDYLVVAGGGGGGNAVGGGGGAGGMLSGTTSVTPGTSYTVTVGTGGASATFIGASYVGNNGGNSVFSSLTAVGGGVGASCQTAGGSSLGAVATSGGSGGGGASFVNTINTQSVRPTPGTGTAGQGNSGGTSASSVPYSSGQNRGSGAGGGGAGTAGYNADNASNPGAGGHGLSSRITGVTVYYAGGGGGSSMLYEGAPGGIGGGGKGAGPTNTCYAGANGFGGGGGGGGNGGQARSGGSGVVILSYSGANSYIGGGANSSINNSSDFDSPTDVVDSLGNSVGNYPIFDRSWNIAGASIGNGNLLLSSDASNAHKIIPTTLPISSGKWYFEMTITNGTPSNAYVAMGLIPWPAPNNDYFTNLPSSTSTTNGFSWQSGTANSLILWTDYIGGASRYVTVNPIAASAVGQTMQIAIDIDNNKLWVGRDNTWYDASGGSTGNPSTGANPTSTNVIRYIGQYGALMPFCSVGQRNEIVANFGATPFTFTPPTGFKSINTKNLKDVGSNNLPDTFGNYVNTPDLVMLKARSATYEWEVFDTVRGPANYLSANSNAASSNNWGTLTSFKPNGYDLGAGAYNNAAGATYVGWAWNRGKTPGFDIVNYGGDGVNNRMIPHNLGQAPAFYITKCLTSYNNAQSFTDWSVYHKDCPTYTTTGVVGKQALWLHRDLAAQGGVGGFYKNATSSEFSPNQINYDNSLGQSYIAYLWAEVPGYSKFGSYVGNNSLDGPFVYTGFKPAFILIKRRDGVSDWFLLDNKRGSHNPIGAGNGGMLSTNQTYAESTLSTYAILDIVSNGFKIRSDMTYGYLNVSGGNYVYAAFAENPFKYANAR